MINREGRRPRAALDTRQVRFKTGPSANMPVTLFEATSAFWDNKMTRRLYSRLVFYVYLRNLCYIFSHSGNNSRRCFVKKVDNATLK